MSHSKHVINKRQCNDIIMTSLGSEIWFLTSPVHGSDADGHLDVRVVQAGFSHVCTQTQFSTRRPTLKERSSRRIQTDPYTYTHTYP